MISLVIFLSLMLSAVYLNSIHVSFEITSVIAIIAVIVVLIELAK